MKEPVEQSRLPLSHRPLLSVKDISVTFSPDPKSARIVDRVSLTLAPGQTLCLVGESGCGKSVTSLAIMGLLASPPARITAGQVVFEGQDLLSLSARDMADLRGDRLAMIFQEPMTSLNPVFKIGEQIVEAVQRHQDLSASEARQHAVAMLKKVRIPAAEQRFDDYPHQLSGGMRQRVMIAMALANSPALLIADEPTTALDVTIQAQILSLIQGLQEASGLALLLITHDLGVVAEVADQVAVMYAGRIVEMAPVADIFENPQHPYTIGLMSSIPALGRREARLAAIPGTVPPPEAFPAGCRFATRCPFATERCWSDVPPFIEAGKNHRVACLRSPLEDNVELLP